MFILCYNVVYRYNICSKCIQLISYMSFYITEKDSRSCLSLLKNICFFDCIKQRYSACKANCKLTCADFKCGYRKGGQTCFLRRHKKNYFRSDYNRIKYNGHQQRKNRKTLYSDVSQRSCGYCRKQSCQRTENNVPYSKWAR